VGATPRDKRDRSASPTSSPSKKTKAASAAEQHGGQNALPEFKRVSRSKTRAKLLAGANVWYDASRQTTRVKCHWHDAGGKNRVQNNVCFEGEGQQVRQDAQDLLPFFTIAVELRNAKAHLQNINAVLEDNEAALLHKGKRARGWGRKRSHAENKALVELMEMNDAAVEDPHDHVKLLKVRRA
jgi:hypothetical protein